MAEKANAHKLNELPSITESVNIVTGCHFRSMNTRSC